MGLPSTLINTTTIPSNPNLTNYYCDPGDIQRRLSVDNTILRIEDSGPGSVIAEAGAFEDAIWDATETINLYCFQHYDYGALKNSVWVNRRATDIAVYLLSCRRGNSPSSSMERRYQESLQWLEKVHDGLYELPGVPVRFSSAPAWSNVRIDQRYPTYRIRVERTISVRESPVGYAQSIDWQSEYDYSL